MNKPILTFSLLSLFFFASSKDIIGTYKTYDDYKNNKMDTMEEYLGYTISKGAVILRFKKDTSNPKVKCKEIWGFILGQRLYRCDQRLGHPACIVSSGTINYYENGLPYLEGYKNKSNVGEFTVGYLCYFSKSLTSEMIPYDPKIPDANDKYKEFKKANPKFETLFKCIGKTGDYSKLRICVRSFNNPDKDN